jgi:hypothetical protein
MDQDRPVTHTISRIQNEEEILETERKEGTNRIDNNAVGGKIKSNNQKAKKNKTKKNKKHKKRT